MFIYGYDSFTTLDFSFSDSSFVLGEVPIYPLVNKKFNFFRALFNTFKDKAIKSDISGIYIYCGLFGMGKTYSAVRDILDLKIKGYKVFSNFSLTFQDGRLISWQDILNVPPNSIIFIDEISDTFNSRAWSKMPRQIFGYFVQNRKLNIRIVCTAQMFDEVDKSIRNKAKYVIDCKKVGRFAWNNYYLVSNYCIKKRKPEKRVFYDIQDYFINYYNTFELVKSLGSSENESDS